MSQRSDLFHSTPDTWPIQGLGGLKGTGKSRSFFTGGFSSAGAVGACAFGTPPAPVVRPAPHPLASRPYAIPDPTRSLLGNPPTAAALPTAPRGQDEPSPKSAGGLSAELAAKEREQQVQ